MKIVVLNGSPNGTLSVTMQYVCYLEQELQQHEWKIINVASTVQHLEKNQDAFREVVEEVRKVREKIMKEFNYDPHAFGKFLAERERNHRSNRKPVKISRRSELAVKQ